jgi:hypothetical protein
MAHCAVRPLRKPALVATQHCLADPYLVTDNPDEIRLDSLPPRFVVKANHGCG